MLPLPPGCEIEFVVGEPHIGQSMHANLEARGRLWGKSSAEQPDPVSGEAADELSGS